MLKNLTIPEIVIASEHPAIPGHFPNAPIIPAALLLDEIAQQLRDHIGLSVLSFSHTRFIKPVQPDQSITIYLEPSSDTDYRFQLTVDNDICCRGKLSCTGSTLALTPPIEKNNVQKMAAAPLYQRLPHAGAMCLIDSIINRAEEAIYCQACSTPSPIGNNQYTPTWAGLEYAAQAAACHGLLSQPTDINSFKTAQIVSVKSISLLQKPTTPNSAPLIAVKRLANLPQAASYQFTLYHNEIAISAGQFNATVN